jgi:hypothetical protein
MGVMTRKKVFVFVIEIRWTNKDGQCNAAYWTSEPARLTSAGKIAMRGTTVKS